MSSQKLQIKDRVKLRHGDKNVKGTVVKVFYFNRSSDIRTCGVLWDNDWPRDNRNPRVFYVKPDDLEYVDTWRLGN